MIAMVPVLLLVAILLGSNVISAQNATNSAAKDDVALANDTVNWVRSKGGFFSDKLDIHRINMGDSTSPLGVFAKENIRKGERLLEVPHSCFIALWDEAKPEMAGDNDPYYNKNYVDNVCHLSHKLTEELYRGNESEYAPYIEYIKHQQHGQLPATWSKHGKDLLRKVAAPGWDMVDWMDHFKECMPLDEHLLALTAQRGYDTALIPVWDLFNHRNGRSLNTRNDPMYASDRLRVYAKRFISKGQEVYASYDECRDCGEEMWEVGTPEILRDFGFVEQYQQRWVYRDQGIWFLVYINELGNLDVHWDIPKDYAHTEDDSFGVPNTDGIAFLRTELERLQKLSNNELKDQRQVPTHEWNSILQFHQASITAISLAVESAEAFHVQSSKDKQESPRIDSYIHSLLLGRQL